MTGLMAAVSSALTDLITMVGRVISAILDTPAEGAVNLHSLLPLFAIGIAIAVFGYAIRAIKNIVWGA